MSLSGALSNALSGLTANARAAGLVSANIANASTESYGRRTLGLSSNGAGTTGGVRIDGVIRHVDAAILSDRRQSDAALANGDSLHAFVSRIETAVGDSEAPGSLANRVLAFENAMIAAAANPAATQRLESVAYSANALADTLRDLSGTVQQARTDADRSIAAQVTRLNDTLVRIGDVNTDIVAAQAGNGDTASLLDERQRLIDSIAEIVPVRIIQRDRGAIALYTTGGGVLLDGKPSVLEFSPTAAVSPHMILSGGPLSGLTLNGNPVTAPPAGMFGGGDLAAQFEIRDIAATGYQAQLDGIARDLVERLGPGGPDATLGATDPGLFTDLGGAFDPLNETGLAGRITLNALVAPGGGGSWRLRDGLNAAGLGDVGDGRLLQGIADALTASGLPASPALSPVSRSFADRAADFTAAVTGDRVRAESAKVYLTTRNTALSELELSTGVDTDQELQILMRIEQQYAANAEVMSTVDELLMRLLNI
ncbi:FlgK family flagellar hook-associated protein [Thetidibacter halocola]|uniref:Flagellar hook-associated protein 1 n=1 Tax=Thetidibacter halocola TaxID=2827239 RepID=A0A8J8B7K5_9RHOB|nr:flagellar basal body rod C-terminal domain-containing protein [Thetidibacter halocola]MBS0123645.1 flagellar hook-associated protein FlgK [Thetidibacter halocola]